MKIRHRSYLKIRRVLCVILAFVLTAFPVPAAADSEKGILFSNLNSADVKNNPTEAATYTPKEDVRLQGITTYHWNDGKGSKAVAISIYTGGGGCIGVWEAKARIGNNVPANVYWDVSADVELKAGTTYYIEDSDKATWSWNEESKKVGFFELRGTTKAAAEKKDESSGSSSNGSSNSGSNSGSNTGNGSGSGTQRPELPKLNIDYSEKEIAEAPKTEMKVSADQPSASAGAFSVDFGQINAMSDDTFTVRELPVHDFGDEGYSVQGYDFSLASGKDDFAGEVCIRLPRTEDDGDLVYFVTKDPETGENVREFHEISEDGKYYLLYVTHFSLHFKTTEMLLGEWFKNNVVNADVSNPLTREGLSAFFYYDNAWYGEVMETKVDYCRDEFWSKIGDSASLPSALEMMKKIDKKSKEAAKNKFPDTVDMGGILFCDTAKKYVDNVDAVNNVNSGYEGMNSFFKDTKSGESLSKTGIGTIVSIITTIAGFALTSIKAVKEVEAGKYNDMNEAAWGHWADYAGTAVGLMGLAGSALAHYAVTAAGGTAAAAAGTLAAPVVVAAAVAGIGLYCYSNSIEKTPYDELSEDEINYRSYFHYYKAGSADKSVWSSRLFYYDEPEKADSSFGEIRYGNIPRLKCLNEKQNELFKRKLRVSGVQGSLNGEDTLYSNRVPDESWLRAIKALYETIKDKPDLLNKAILEFYQNYSSACSPYLNTEKYPNQSALTQSDYLSFCRESMAARGTAEKTAQLPSKKQMKAYAEKMYKELLRFHQPIFKEFAKRLTHQAQLEVDKMIEDELVPLLNTRMIFTVEDTSLENPENFAESVYSAAPKKTGDTNPGKYKEYTDIRQLYEPAMEFCVRSEDGSGYEHVGPPVFKPGVGKYTSLGRGRGYKTWLYEVSDEYYFPVADNFWPKYEEGSKNKVFYCTYYHYLMMGAPSAMSFYNLLDENAEEEIVPFEIPGPNEKGIVTVNIVCCGKNDIQELEGLWRSPAENTKYANKGDRNLTLSVEDGGSANSCMIYEKDKLKESYTQGGADENSRFLYIMNTDKKGGTLIITDRSGEKKQVLTLEKISDTILYIKELDYYIEKSELSYDGVNMKLQNFTGSDFNLYQAKGQNAYVNVKEDKSVEITIPQINVNGVKERSGVYYSKANLIQVKARLSGEPDRKDYEDGTVAKVYYMTECSPVTLYTRYDKVRSNGEVKTEEEKNLTIKDPVLFGAKDTNVPVSSVLLYYDDNNRLKKAAVMINGPDNRVSIIMSV